MRHAKFLHHSKNKLMEMASTNTFGKADFILLLEKGEIPGWWDRKAHKITFFIISQLIDYTCEIEGNQEQLVKNALFALEPDIVLTTKIFNLKKKVDRYTKKFPGKIHNSIDSLYNQKLLLFVGKACEINGINKTFLENILSSSDQVKCRDLIITNEIVIELYHFKEKITIHGVNLKCG